MSTKLYVITGAPCSGKTTLINELERRGYRVFPEVAREYVDEELAKGRAIEEVVGDQQAFQEEVCRRKSERESSITEPGPVFLDRGLPDTRAYVRVRGVTEHPWMTDCIEGARYEKVFLLEPLPIVADYLRKETSEEQRTIHQAILEAYRSCGYEPVIVPVLPSEDRVQFVIDRQ